MILVVPDITVVNFGGRIRFILESSLVAFLVSYPLDCRQCFNHLIVSNNIDFTRVLNCVSLFLIFSLHYATKLLPELHKSLLYIVGYFD